MTPTVPTFREQAVLDAYKEAIKGALESADAAAEAVATASFSIATAYGALLGLVKPKDAAVAVPLVTPILIFALAAVVALVSRSLGVKTSLTPNTVDGVSSDISNTVWAKRIGTWLALFALAAALIVAGLLVQAAYAPAP
jgi:hypothetical protein